jgi:hypothetical protein
MNAKVSEGRKTAKQVAASFSLKQTFTQHTTGTHDDVYFNSHEHLFLYRSDRPWFWIYLLINFAQLKVYQEIGILKY